MSPCFVVANTHVKYFELCASDLALETPRFRAGENQSGCVVWQLLPHVLVHCPAKLLLYQSI